MLDVVVRVMVAGVDVVIEGRLTGAAPGRVLRAGCDSVTVPARPGRIGGDRS